MVREGGDIRIGRTGSVMNEPIICKKSVAGCLHCAFNGRCHGKKLGRPMCMSFERPDRESVIFKPYTD